MVHEYIPVIDIGKLTSLFLHILVHCINKREKRLHNLVPNREQLKYINNNKNNNKKKANQGLPSGT